MALASRTLSRSRVASPRLSTSASVKKPERMRPLSPRFPQAPSPEEPARNATTGCPVSSVMLSTPPNCPVASPHGDTRRLASARRHPGHHVPGRAPASQKLVRGRGEGASTGVGGWLPQKHQMPAVASSGPGRRHLTLRSNDTRRTIRARSIKARVAPAFAQNGSKR